MLRSVFVSTLLCLLPLVASAQNLSLDGLEEVRPPAVSSAGPTLGAIPIQPDYKCDASAGGNFTCIGLTTTLSGSNITYGTSPWGRTTIFDIGTATAASATVPAGMWSNSYTIVVVTKAPPRATSAVLFRTGGPTGEPYLELRNNGSNNYSFVGYASASTAVVGRVDSWAVVSLRRDTSNNLTVRANGASTTVGSSTSFSNTSLYFGGWTGAGFGAGEAATYLIYRRALTDEELTLIEAGWFGALVGDRPITTTRASPADCQADDGTWYRVGDNAPCVNSKGVFSGRGVVNYWPNSTTPSLWPALGTPVVSGQTVTDDDAAGNEAVTGLASAPSAGTWTAACYVRSGTLTTARVAIVTDGTGGVTCSPATVGATATRLTCTATVGGTPTIVRGYVYPGSAAADTGSINVDQCQLVKDSTPGPRHDCTTAPCERKGDNHAISSAGFPTAAGEIELLATPLSGFDTAFSRRLFYWRNGNDGASIYLSGANNIHLELGNGAGIRDYADSGGLMYADRSVRTIFTWDRSTYADWIDGARVVAAAPTNGVPTSAMVNTPMYLGASASSQIFNGYVWPTYIGPPRARTENSGYVYFHAPFTTETGDKTYTLDNLHWKTDIGHLTTTRPTEVPCLQADGTWGTAGVDTACIAPGGVPGVESYGAVTNYWLNSTAPTSWEKTGVPTAVALADGWEITDDTASAEGYKHTQADTTVGVAWTITCEVARGLSGSPLTAIDIGVFYTGSARDTKCAAQPLGTGYSRISCGGVATATGVTSVVGYVESTAAQQGTWRVRQCQLEKSSTHGRRCDSGGTATTCDGETGGHTVSGTGWPSGAGELHVRIRLARAPRAGDGVRGIAAGTAVFGLAGDGSLYLHPGTGDYFTAPLSWSLDTTYDLILRYSPTRLAIVRDGAEVWSQSGSFSLTWGDTVALGAVGGVPLDGTVSLVSMGEP